MTIDTDTRSELAELKDEYCDAYKDVHGVKGRFIYGMDLTVAEVKEMLVQLQEEYLAHRAREIAREQKNIKAAQNLIGGLIARGAKDVAKLRRFGGCIRPIIPAGTMGSWTMNWVLHMAGFTGFLRTA